MLNAMARGDNSNVVANIAALVPHFDPKKESIRKMQQVLSSNESNKTGVNTKEKGQADTPDTLKFREQSSSYGPSSKADSEPNVDVVI